MLLSILLTYLNFVVTRYISEMLGDRLNYMSKIVKKKLLFILNLFFELHFALNLKLCMDFIPFFIYLYLFCLNPHRQFFYHYLNFPGISLMLIF